MKDYNSEVGSRIRRLRESHKYSRELLAEKACISAQFLADIEKGRKSMSITTLKHLSAALEVSPDYVVNGPSDSKSPEQLYLPLHTLIDQLSPDEQKTTVIILEALIELLHK